MRVSKVFSMISFLTATGIAMFAIAQLHAACFQEREVSCATWYTTYNPYPCGVNIAADCTQNACGCSGNPALPAGPENPSDCGCAGIVTVHINTKVIGAFPVAPNQHNNAKDDWTIKTKANGEPDDVECGLIRSCDGCKAQYHEGPNGEPIFVQNICGAPGPAHPIMANQAKVVGNPC